MDDEQPTYAPRFYSPKVIAGCLGLTETTIRRYINTGKLPATRVGGVMRVSEEDYKRFLEANGFDGTF